MPPHPAPLRRCLRVVLAWPPAGGCRAVPALTEHRRGGKAGLGHCLPAEPPAFCPAAVAPAYAPLTALAGGSRVVSGWDLLQLDTHHCAHGPLYSGGGAIARTSTAAGSYVPASDTSIGLATRVRPGPAPARHASLRSWPAPQWKGELLHGPAQRQEATCRLQIRK